MDLLEIKTAMAGYHADAIAKLKSIGSRVDAIEAELDRPAGGAAPNSDGSKKELAAFIDYMVKKDASGLLALGHKSVNIGTAADGGFAIPRIIDAQIDKFLLEQSPIRQIATVRTFNGPGFSEYKKLVNARGASSGWASETGTRSETSTPTLREVSFTSGELYAEPRATNWSLQDLMFDVAAWLGEEVGEEFAFQEGIAFISGNGSNRPTGFLYNAASPISDDAGNSPQRPFGTLQYIPTGVAGAFPNDQLGSPIGYPDNVLTNCVAALKTGYLKNARWVMNRRTKAVISKWRNADGERIWHTSLVAGQPDTLLGYPVLIADGMQDIGTNTYPIAFGDFKRGYTIIDTGTILLTDPFTTKGYTKFYTARRVGGKITNSEAIKLIKCAAS